MKISIFTGLFLLMCTIASFVFCDDKNDEFINYEEELNKQIIAIEKDIKELEEEMTKQIIAIAEKDNKEQEEELNKAEKDYKEQEEMFDQVIAKIEKDNKEQEYNNFNRFNRFKSYFENKYSSRPFHERIYTKLICMAVSIPVVFGICLLKSCCKMCFAKRRNVKSVNDPSLHPPSAVVISK